MSLNFAALAPGKDIPRISRYIVLRCIPLCQ